MPIFKDTLLTERGFEMAVKALNGQGSFKIIKAVGSSKDYRNLSNNQLKQLTSLENEVDGRINETEDVNSKTTAIKTSYTNETAPSGYMVNTAGLYAKDDATGQEFLYAVTPSEVGQLIPEQSSNNFEGFDLKIYVVVGNVEKMTVELTPGGDASVEYVKSAVSKAKGDIMAELDKLSDSVKTDLSPELAKKLNASDYKVDFDKLNNALNLKANNDDLQKAASDINLRVNDRELIENHKKDIESITGNMFKFQGNWSGSAIDLQNQPDGIYEMMNNTKGCPGWFSGYGLIAKYHNSTDLFMNIFDNVGHSGSFSKFGDWVQNANGNDLVNLQNTVNGVLARQSSSLTAYQQLVDASLYIPSDWSGASLHYDPSNKTIYFHGFLKSDYYRHNYTVNIGVIAAARNNVNNSDNKFTIASSNMPSNAKVTLKYDYSLPNIFIDLSAYYSSGTVMIEGSWIRLNF